jgi:diguanylate cyclase
MAEPETDPLIDTLGSILRALGRYSFDLAQVEARSVQESFEQWARHATIGAPVPGEPALKQSGAVAGRSWRALRDFVVTHRKLEQTYVTQSSQDFRQVIWAFVNSMNRVVGTEAQTDTEMRAQMSALQVAVDRNALDEIKRVAATTIAAVDRAIEVRRQRQRDELQQMGTKLSALGEQLETARREGAIDGLTAIYNRKAFDEHLRQTVELSSMLNEPVCLVMTDVDHFKKVNDTYGHPAGDAVLRAVASTIVRTFKRKRDFVARYGGEEFAILLRDITFNEAQVLTDRLVKAMRAMTVPFEDKKLCVTVSAGLTMKTDTDTAVAWVERADQALYRAKHEGRDRFVVLP